jgi:hypothetical protein
MRMHLVAQALRSILLALAVLSPMAASAQDTRTIDLRFPRGASGTTVSDSITGYQAINYRLGVSAGQRMSVQLDTDNLSNYFNITAPGASEALFNGSISGNSTNFVIPSSGNYVISVYLMRNAARRSETANFSLTTYVEAGAAVAPRPTPPAVNQPNFADGLEGGPDYWQVSGLSGGDTLNVRAGPSTSNSVIATVRNGDTLRNLGCTMNGSTRWCQIETQRGARGWVAGRYLHESFGTAPAHPSTLPAQAPRPVPSNPTPTAVDTSLMPRYCAGEVSAAYGVRPTEITTNMAFQSGNRFVVQGYFDRGDDTTFFNCWFGLDGAFQSVS